MHRQVLGWALAIVGVVFLAELCRAEIRIENAGVSHDGAAPVAVPKAREITAPFLPDRVIVRFKPGRSRAVQEASIVKAKGFGIRKTFRSVRDLLVVDVPAGQVSETIAAFRADPEVLYAEPDFIVELLATPNDEFFDLLWGLKNTAQTGEGPFCFATATVGSDINAVRAWDFWTGDPEFRIAIIDTGINYLHPDLIDNIWTNPSEVVGDANGDGCPGICGVDDDGDGLTDEDSQDRQPGAPGYAPDRVKDDDENGWNDDLHGYDTFNNDSDPMDDNSHGSHVAGTIGGVGDNGIGVAGLNWRCKLVGLKMFGRTGSGGGISDAIEAIDYVIANRIRVSNNSWGFSGGSSQALYDAIEASQSVGHIFVAAAGNDFGRNNDHIPSYPNSYDLPNILSVAAADNRFGRAHFSNLGRTTVDLAAPGTCILSTVLGTDYGYKDGTSMATPHVTGVVALVTSRYPDLHWRQIRERVLYTVRANSAFVGRTLFAGTLEAAAAIGDCNRNGILDQQEINAGNSQDCSGNGIPDECEPDCNDNGRADSCDLFDRKSMDCNDNAMPDECEPDCNRNGVSDSCDVSAGNVANCNRNYVPDVCEINMASTAPGGPFYCESACLPDCNRNGAPDSCDLAGGLSSDCTHNRIPDECEPDCNANGMADSCDIEDEESNDCGSNGIPDECEPDCNENENADSCDIYTSTSFDCNRNAVPDECEPGQHSDCNANHINDSCDLIFGTGFDCNSNGTLDECDIRDGTSSNSDGSRYPDECDGRGFSIVPVSSSGEHEIEGNEIRMFGGGQTVTLEIRLFNWDLDLDGDPPLRAYELRVDADGFTSGRYGRLSPARISCGSDDDCFGLSVCLEQGYCDAWGPAFIDALRPDFVFRNLLSIQLTNPVQLAPDIIFLAALWSQADVIPDSGEVSYVGTLLLDVAPVAAGTFTIDFSPRSAQLRKAGGEPITVPTLTPAKIVINPDCNLNRIPDDVEIDNGSSRDCNQNGIPDECIQLEPDCNDNGRPDTCDIQAGHSDDCNSNEIPDECAALEADCNVNALPDACDIAVGISVDCNTNGIPDDCLHLERDCNENFIPDACDIAFGLSEDCDANGIPDECRLHDCNLNGIPDQCDMNSGVSEDCNHNGRPDTCDLADGTSADCNKNDIPDDCRRLEPDCNENGSPDDCDIDENRSDDCNANKRPDECDVFPGGSEDADGNGVPDECERTHYVPAQYPTIQAAIDAAFSGDLILVADGVYAGPGNSSVSFQGKRLTLRSENGPHHCIVDGRKSGRGFFFGGQETADARLEGFTITGGQAQLGGGVLCRRSSPTIANCVFVNNTAGLHGGALYCEALASPRISYCVFARNTAGNDGGAIHCENQSSPSIENCLIVQNLAVGGGGAVFCDNLSNPLIRHCTIAGNRASYGGALYCARRTLQAPGFSAPVVRSCILWRDTAYAEGSEIFMASGAQLAVERSAVLLGLESVTVRATALLHWDSANIAEYPVFRNPAGDDNDFDAWEDNNYRLHGLSPCINVGAVEAVVNPLEVDFDGHDRILCGQADMGAFESGLGDFDCNRRVELADLAGWHPCSAGPAPVPGGQGVIAVIGCDSFDFTFDGDVDLEDFARFQRLVQP